METGRAGGRAEGARDGEGNLAHRTALDPVSNLCMMFREDLTRNIMGL